MCQKPWDISLFILRFEKNFAFSTEIGVIDTLSTYILIIGWSTLYNTNVYKYHKSQWPDNLYPCYNDGKMEQYAIPCVLHIRKCQPFTFIHRKQAFIQKYEVLLKRGCINPYQVFGVMDLKHLCRYFVHLILCFLLMLVLSNNLFEITGIARCRYKWLSVIRWHQWDRDANMLNHVMLLIYSVFKIIFVYSRGSCHSKQSKYAILAFFTYACKCNH